MFADHSFFYLLRVVLHLSFPLMVAKPGWGSSHSRLGQQIARVRGKEHFVTYNSYVSLQSILFLF